MKNFLKNTAQGPQIDDVKYSLYIRKHLAYLEPRMFVDDMLNRYSITLCKDYSIDTFFEFDGDYKGFKNVFGYDFLRSELDKLLSRITENLLFFGVAYVERVFWYDENDAIKRVTYHCINCFRIKKHRNDIVYRAKDSEKKTYKGKIDNENIIIFKLKDMGFSKRFFLKKIKKLKKLGIPGAQLSKDKDFSWSVFNSKQDLYLLRIMKGVYWNARKSNNEYITEPYFIYRKVQYEKLANTFLEYLITKLNASICDMSKTIGVTGNIKFNSITENYDALLEEFSTGQKNCKEIGNVIFKGL